MFCEIVAGRDPASIVFEDGAEVAGQEVFDGHPHVIARFAGDGFGLRFPDDEART